MLTFLKKHLRLLVVAVVIVAVGGFVIYSRQKPKTYDFVEVTRRSLVQAVVVTGRVKPAEDIDLNFETGGRIVRLNVKAGDTVKAGQVLAEIESSELRASIAQAQAAVAIERANLDELKRGTRPEELAVEIVKTENMVKALADAKADLVNAEASADIDLKNDYDTVSTTLNSAYLNAQDAITKQLDPFFEGVLSGTPRLSFVTSDSQAKVDAESGRVQMDDILASFKSDVDTLPETYEGRDAALIRVVAHLNNIKKFLDRVSATTNGSTSLSSTNLAAYKSAINAARTNINASATSISALQQSIAAQRASNQSAVTSAKTKVNEADRALSVQQQQLKLKQAGATSSQIASAEAQVRQAEANVAAVSAKLLRTRLVAPITGVVTKRSAEPGENVGPNISVLTMISGSNLEIESNIPEVDIGKLTLGDTTTITLDAYPGQAFVGKVAYVDPAETIIDGVVNFRMKVAFDAPDERLKSGLTANLSIETDRKDNVLALPQYVIVEIEGGSHVRKVKNEQETTDVPVVLGLRSQDGYVEIISGVSENESVVNVSTVTP